MAGIGKAPKIIIKGTTQDIDLGEYHFENFRYIEDINQGFPTIEFALTDNLYELLRKLVYGDEELIIQEFEQDKFKFNQKSFRIKSIGSLGLQPKPAAKQTVKIIAIDKNYDSILKNQKSYYFKKGEVKKISDLLENFLSGLGIVETDIFKINITPTAPIMEHGFQNLFIPYSRDAMKVIRKLSNYAVQPDGTGAFIFFINRRGLNFVPVSTLFKDVTDETPKIQVTDIRENYGINNLKLSPFNAFTNFITGHEKKVMGFNLLEKDYNIINYSANGQYIEHSKYIDSGKKTSNIKTMPITGMATHSVPFLKEFSKGNIKTYFTPLDDPLMLKGFADRLQYSQMFTYNIETEIDFIQEMPDLAVGEIVNVEFKTSQEDSWESLNGGWLLKSMAYSYPGDNATLKLTRIGIGSLPEVFTKMGEV